MSNVSARTDQDQANRAAPLAGSRVIIVLGPLELGGSERQALLFARYLAHEQHADVQVWGTMGEPGTVAALCEEHGIAWRIVPRPWAVERTERAKALARFGRILRQAHPDIILPYMALPNLACGLVWRWTGAQLCVWNQRDDGIGRIGTHYEPWAARLTPWFIANSTHGADYLVKTFSARPERVRVVHNGVEFPPPAADRAAWRQELGICDECFVACMVANLTEYKDHETLLRAWRFVINRLKQEGRNAQILLAGRFDKTYETLKALAHDLDLGTSVHFLGEVRDVSGLLGAADAGVFCSNSEGSPNSVIEYMAAGLAVAGTDIPAMRETLSPQNHALLARPKDAEALAAQILELAASPELRTRIGAVNRQRVETEFSVRRMCEETVRVILGGLRKDS